MPIPDAAWGGFLALAGVALGYLANWFTDGRKRKWQLEDKTIEKQNEQLEERMTDIKEYIRLCISRYTDVMMDCQNLIDRHEDISIEPYENKYKGTIKAHEQEKLKFEASILSLKSPKIKET